MGRGGFGLKGRFRWSRVSCLIRVTSWIVSFVRKTKDDPRSHTNQHEAKHSCLQLVPTFEAKLREHRLRSVPPSRSFQPDRIPAPAQSSHSQFHLAAV